MITHDATDINPNSRTNYCLNSSCLYEWVITEGISDAAKEAALTKWYIVQFDRYEATQRIPTVIVQVIIRFLGIQFLGNQCAQSQCYAYGWEIGITPQQEHHYEDDCFPLVYLGRFVYARSRPFNTSK